MCLEWTVKCQRDSNESGKTRKNSEKHTTENKSQKEDKEKGWMSEAIMGSGRWRALTSCSPWCPQALAPPSAPLEDSYWSRHWQTMTKRRRRRKQSLWHLGSRTITHLQNTKTTTTVTRIKRDDWGRKNNDRRTALTSDRQQPQTRFGSYFTRCAAAAACLPVMAPDCENSFAINMQKPFQGTSIFFPHYVILVLAVNANMLGLIVTMHRNGSDLHLSWFDSCNPVTDGCVHTWS